jgi:REP element-mobilizing transposase RayT
MTNHLPQRKHLPHNIPSWVQQGTRHFITVRCREHGTTPLADATTAQKIIDSACHYDVIGKWFLWQIVVMPDHIHLMITFDLSKGIQKTMQAWKAYHAKANAIRFQDGFFEHRIRDADAFAEKSEYMRMNPVAKGLAERPDDWPYRWERTDG